MAEYLLSQGARTDLVNYRESTPLDEAKRPSRSPMTQHNREMVAALIEAHIAKTQ